jgi:hypothetical protein
MTQGRVRVSDRHPKRMRALHAIEMAPITQSTESETRPCTQPIGRRKYDIKERQEDS